jgi:mono/diheme cytochrome c family protein
MKSIAERLKDWSPKFSPVLYLAALVGAVAAAIVVPLALVAMPYMEFLGGMAAQHRGRTQMTYGRAFGQALPVEQPEVDGVAPRGYEPYPYAWLGSDADAAKKAGELVQNPLPVTMENLEAGRKVYNVSCIVCHGKMGEGNGMATSAVKAGRFGPPPSLHTKEAREYKDGRIFHVITMGQNKMPSYAAQLEPDERWQAALYVRALQRAMNPRPEDLKE